MNLWQYLPRIKYNPPPAGGDDFASRSFKELEQWFKFVGWCIVIGTLHYGFVKTNSLYFGIPEGVLSVMLAWLVYAYFARFTIVLPWSEIVFHAGYPRSLHWPSLVAMILVVIGARMIIGKWVDAVVSLQAK
jgi:hypothetical protein